MLSLTAAIFSALLLLLILFPAGKAEAWAQWRGNNGVGLKWDRREIDVEASVGGSSSDTCMPKAQGLDLYEYGPCWEDVIRSAADRWYRIDARLRMNITSSSEEPGCVSGDSTNTVTADNTICGRAFDERSLAITVNRYNPQTGVILESDISFNTSYAYWNSYSGALRSTSNGDTLVDMHRVALHEFGHTWGLDHPDEAGQIVASMMNSKISDIDRLQPDDIAGILAIYGSAGSSGGAGDPVRAILHAIAPVTNGDQSTLRIRCEDEERDCAVFLDCTDQTNGTGFSGALSEEIPAGGTRALSSAEIMQITGGSPWQKRLACKLRSPRQISGQVWTRSGEGVLINNTGIAEPSSEEDEYIVRLHSIPAPGSADESNIRVYCPVDAEPGCGDIAIRCWRDDGTLHEGMLDSVKKGSVAHFQSQRLAELIGHRWQGMELSCRLASSFRISAQILTRTGANALVNNSEVSLIRTQ